jgi:hypothetical protein
MSGEGLKGPMPPDQPAPRLLAGGELGAEGLAVLAFNEGDAARIFAVQTMREDTHDLPLHGAGHRVVVGRIVVMVAIRLKDSNQWHRS